MAVDNSELLQAGVSLMADAGQPLTAISTDRRVSIYRLPDGRTVRGRTCNLHQLPLIRTKAEVAVSGIPERLLRAVSETDFTLAVTPEKERTAGAVIAFLIPTEVIIEQINAAQRAGRKDWSLFLDQEIWTRYRLAGSAHAALAPESAPPAEEEVVGTRASHTSATPRTLGEVIAEARRDIAAAAHVAESAVKIQIDLN